MAANTKNIIVGGARVFIGAAAPDGAAAASVGFIGNTNDYWQDGDANAVTDAQSVTEVTDKGVDGWGDDIGFTSEGIDLTVEPEFNDVEVDQLLDSAILFKTSQRLSFATTLTEATLTNLAVAIGQADPAAHSDPGDAGSTQTLGLSGGALGEFPREIGLVAVANGPRSYPLSGSERIFEAFRAISVESVTAPVKRSEVTQYPVSFRCLPASDGAYMKVVDRIYGS